MQQSKPWLFRFIFLFCLMQNSQILAGELVVAFPEGNYYPHYDSTQGKMRGYLPALMERFGQDHDMQFSLLGMPIKRYQSFIRTGEVDFILPSNPAWSDTEAGPLTFSSVVMISRSGFVRSQYDLGKPIERIATVTGYWLPDITPSFLIQQPKIFYTIDTYASLSMLKARRVDAVYAHLDFVREWVRNQSGEQNIFFEADAGFDNYSYHLATLKHSQLIERFDHWMQRNRSKVIALMRQYRLGTDMLF